MGIIQFKEANCKNCYKCIRSCPVKAITFKDDQAKIVEEDCMLCGNCLKICPQNAKTVKSDIEIVKSYIQKKEPVYASLAPSFIAAFEDNQGRSLFLALKKLGFTHVEETAIGAMAVTKQYEKLMKEQKMKNIITTACPSINFLIEKYYPELIDQMAPVVSPMIAHAKMLRERYGQEIRVVFIGPCLSKKDECNDMQNNGSVDAVLTFEELCSWMTAEGLYHEDEFSEELKATTDMTARIYPMPGGILKTIEDEYKAYYQCVSIDGVDRCMKILDTIKNNEIDHYFIEMNSCIDGCIAGPCMNEMKGGLLAAREKLLHYVKQSHEDGDQPFDLSTGIEFRKKFIDRTRRQRKPSEEEIQAILNSIGKYTKDKELNCGACGYSTCREKALAVYHNKAQLHMCLPFMRERAESISNLIINNTPNAIFALDHELRIQEINTSAREKFRWNMEEVIGENIYTLLPCEDFITVFETGESIYDKKYYYDKFQMTVLQSVIMVPDQNIMVVIIKDISEEEKQRIKMHQMQKDNIDITQKVIEKQMRVAQEVASLLGETTAETKVALTKLKKSIMDEMSEIQ